MKRLLAVLALLAACEREPAHVYPPDVVDNFMRSCGRTAGEGMCKCALRQLEDRYTADEFHALEARVAKGEMPKEIGDAAAACR